MKPIVLMSACACLALPAQAQQPSHSDPSHSAAPSPYILKEAVPDFPKEGQLEARVRPITVQPGMGDWHTHPTPIVIYVVEGVFSVEIRGKGVAQVKAGQAVLEPANTVLRGGNPGQSPTKIVVFQVSAPEAPFSQPAPSQ